MSGVVVGAAIGAGVSYMNGQQQKKSAEQARRQAQMNAQKQEKQADEANNRANQRTANSQGALDAAQQAGKGGASGTMLTGSQGVDPNALRLGKNTLLGQ